MVCLDASSGFGYLPIYSCNTRDIAVFTTAATSAPLNPSVSSDILFRLRSLPIGFPWTLSSSIFSLVLISGLGT